MGYRPVIKIQTAGAAAMDPSTRRNELQPATRLRKVVLGGSHAVKSNNPIPAAARLLLTWAILMVASGAANAQFGSGKTAVARQMFQLPANGAPAVRQVVLLSIDERAFPLRHNLSLFLTKPEVRREPVLAPLTSPDAPDNSAAHFNGTVLHENGRFSMWYYAVHAIANKAGSVRASPVCYAESSDGISWSRPNLGQVEWRGSR